MDCSKRPQSLQKQGWGRARWRVNLYFLPISYGSRKSPDSLRIPPTRSTLHTPSGTTRRGGSLQRLRKEEFALAAKSRMRLLLPHQKIAKLGKGAASGSGARFDGVINALEIVPSQGLHVGTQDEVGVTLPGLKLVLLSGTDSSADHLKDVGGRAAVAIVQSNGDAHDKFRTQLASGAGGYRSDEPSVRETTGTQHDRLEQTRKGATGADGLREAALSKDDRLTGTEVRGDDCGGDQEILKLLGIEEAVN